MDMGQAYSYLQLLPSPTLSYQAVDDSKVTGFLSRLQHQIKQQCECVRIPLGW
jgi:hypothetical protein